MLRTDSIFIALGVLLVSCVSCTTKSETPQAPPKPPYEFLGSWGEKGTGPGKLSSPRALTTDRHGLVYIVDGGSRFVHKFDAKGQPLLSFETASLRMPGGIAVDSGGGIYVTDRERAAVLVFGYDGRHIGTLRGGAGRRFRDPYLIVVDANDAIYVSEMQANRIQKLTAQGRLLAAWGRGDSTPEFFEDVNAMAIAEDGTLYVADSGGRRILKCSGSEDSAPSVEAIGNPSAPIGPLGDLAVGRGHLFGLDVKFRSIRAWTLDGKRGPEIGLAPFLSSFDEPLLGMALVSGSEILVLTSEPRVLRFRLNF